MSERPLSDHPFCQQEQEPDMIDMMHDQELRGELRKALAKIERLEGALQNIRDDIAFALQSNGVADFSDLVATADEALDSKEQTDE